MAKITYPGQFAVVNKVRPMSVDQSAESKTIFEAENNKAITLNCLAFPRRIEIILIAKLRSNCPKSCAAKNCQGWLADCHIIKRNL